MWVFCIKQPILHIFSELAKLAGHFFQILMKFAKCCNMQFQDICPAHHICRTALLEKLKLEQILVDSGEYVLKKPMQWFLKVWKQKSALEHFSPLLEQNGRYVLLEQFFVFGSFSSFFLESLFAFKKQLNKIFFSSNPF